MLVLEIMNKINKIAEIEARLAEVREDSWEEAITIDDGVIDDAEHGIFHISEIEQFLREYRECLSMMEVK